MAFPHQRSPRPAQLDAALDAVSICSAVQSAFAHTWAKAGNRRRGRAAIIRRDKRILLNLCIIHQVFRNGSGILFELADLLIKVLVERILDDPSPRAL